jgi:hypothetical protein
MLIESMEKTLVGYDQWHPQMPASAIRRGTEEAQLLDPASINANSTVLALAQTSAQGAAELTAPGLPQPLVADPAQPTRGKQIAREA